MFQHTRYGIRPGTGVTIHPTGVPGDLTTGIIITGIIRITTVTTTGIIVTVITTATRIIMIIITTATVHIPIL